MREDGEVIKFYPVALSDVKTDSRNTWITHTALFYFTNV